MKAIAIATAPAPSRTPGTMLASLALAALLGAPLSAADEPSACPMHAQHMQEASGSPSGGTGAAAAAHDHEEALDARGAAAMGFSQQATVHHFVAADDGGAIEVTARDAADASTIAAVRSHLKKIAGDFAAGDFSIPRAVHDQEPAGVQAMRTAAGDLAFRYEELPAGGRVRIVATSPAAVRAVHDFLRFQIVEHRTGDPIPDGG